MTENKVIEVSIEDQIVDLEKRIESQKAMQNMSCYWEYFNDFQKTIDGIQVKIEALKGSGA